MDKKQLNLEQRQTARAVAMSTLYYRMKKEFRDDSLVMEAMEHLDVLAGEIEQAAVRQYGPVKYTHMEATSFWRGYCRGAELDFGVQDFGYQLIEGMLPNTQ